MSALRASLSEYRRRVLRGESIVVEYYGSPVAVFKPYETGVSGVELPLTQFRDQMRECWEKLDAGVVAAKSEERRVGKEGRSRWSPDH